MSCRKSFAYSNICKQNIVCSFIPVIIFSIIICPRAGNIFLDIWNTWFTAFKCSWGFKLFEFLFLLIFFLYFFNYVIIFKFLFPFWCILKPSFTYSKAWFFNYQIWIIFLLFNNPCRNVILVGIIHSWSRSICIVLYSFSFCWGFENKMRLFFLLIWPRVIFSWAWIFLLFWLFRPNFSWSKLSSISSLNLIDQFIFHRISRFIIPRPWLFNSFTVDEFWESICIFRWNFLFILPNFLLEIIFRIVWSWSNIFTCMMSRTCEPFSPYSKTRHCWSRWFIEFFNFWNF